MAIYTGQMVVGTTPTAIDGTDRNPLKIRIHNLDTTKNIFLGNETVSATDGYQLNKGDTQEFILNPYEVLYAVSATGGETISWFKQVY